MKFGNPFGSRYNFRITSSTANTTIFEAPICSVPYRIMGIIFALEVAASAGNFTVQIATDNGTAGTYVDILSSNAPVTFNATYANRVGINLTGESFRNALTAASAALIAVGRRFKVYVKTETTALAGGGASGVLFLG